MCLVHLLGAFPIFLLRLRALTSAGMAHCSAMIVLASVGVPRRGSHRGSNGRESGEPAGPARRALDRPGRCQLWLTCREDCPERNVRSLAPQAQRSESSRQGAGPDRAAGSGQPGRRQAGRPRRVRTEDRLRARLPGLLPATRKRADRAAVRWRQVESGRRHRTRATHRSRLEEPDTR
jgi:hypothetical protein